MRIAFLTAGLEPARDGVGDYARLLAAACVARGHAACLLALHDADVVAPFARPQSVRGIEVPTLRLPATAAWSARLARARDWLAVQAPEHVSLQFVGYAFHPRGLATGLGARLARLIGDRPVHVMFHETWIGLERNAPWSHRAIGRLQRATLRALVRRLDPARVHTSNPWYAAALAEAGIRADVLPLFGNVPLAPRPAPGWLRREADAAAPGRAIDGLVFGVFGTIHPEWDPEPLVREIAAAGRRETRTHALLAVGRQGAGGSRWRALARRHGADVRIGWLGERSTADVSRFLQSIDYGVATSPWHLLGKSGTVAAMLDHGLPVLVPRAGPVGAVAEASDELLQRFDGDLAACLARLPPRRAPRDGSATVAERFLAALAGGEPTARGLHA